MKKLLIATALMSLTLIACAPAQSAETSNTPVIQKSLTATTGPQAPYQSDRMDGLEEMIIAGGCFWCVESDFEKVTGVREAISGYSGGGLDNPTYKKVGTNRTGHYEAVKVTYDPSVVTYRQLIDYFWKHIDPTDTRGQFCDKGESYLSAIFVTPDQRAEAEDSLRKIEASKPFAEEIVTPILSAVTFYEAETYHQDYYKKNPAHYQRYRNGCGRDKRLKQLWGDQ